MGAKTFAPQKAIIKVIVMLLLYQTISEPIFIDYSSQINEGSILYQYYFDIENGLYVDVGSQHPIQMSSTLNLYTNGWKGINIQANKHKLKSFLYMRNKDINLNIKIDNNNIFDPANQKQSKQVSKNQYINQNSIKNKKQNQFQKQVNSLTLGQLCQNYYTKKLIFLNIRAPNNKEILQGNVWSNDLCRPQLIFNRYTEDSQKLMSKMSRSILKLNNYSLIQSKIKNLDIFIANQVQNKYHQKFQKGKQILDAIKVVKFPEIRKIIQKQFNVSSQYLYNNGNNKHYDPIHSPIYYHFCKKNVPIYIDQILQESNIIKNKTIFIFNFNQTSSYIVLDKFSITLWQTVKIGQQQFWRFDIKDYNKKSKKDNTYQLYIFNHKINDKIDPQIIPMKMIRQKLGDVEVYADYYEDVKFFSIRQTLYQQNQLKTFKIIIAVNGALLGLSLIIILCLSFKVWSLSYKRLFQIQSSRINQSDKTTRQAHE